MKKKDKIDYETLTGSVWIFAGNVFAQFLTFLVMLIVARNIPPEQFGIFGKVLVVIVLVDWIKDFGFGTRIVQKKHLTKTEISTLNVCIMSISVFITIVLNVFSVELASVLNDDRCVSYIRLASYIVVLKGIGVVHQEYLVRELRFKIRSIIDVIAKVVSSIVIIVMISMGYTISALITGQLFLVGIATFLSIIYSDILLKDCMFFRYKYFKNNVKFGMKVLSIRVIYYLRGESDKLIGGKLTNSTDWGYYTYSYKMTEAVKNMIGQAISPICLPLFQKKAAISDQELFKSFFNLNKISCYLSMYAFVSIILVADQLVFLALGDEWFGIERYLVMSCIVQIINVISIPVDNLYICKEYVGTAVIVGTINSFFSALVMVTLTMTMGAIGLAYAMLFAVLLNYISNTLCLLYLLKINFKQFVGSMNIPLSAGLIMLMTGLAVSKIVFADNVSHESFWLLCQIIMIIGVSTFSYFVILCVYDKPLILNLLNMCKICTRKVFKGSGAI